MAADLAGSSAPSGAQFDVGGKRLSLARIPAGGRVGVHDPEVGGDVISVKVGRSGEVLVGLNVPGRGSFVDIRLERLADIVTRSVATE